MAAALAAGPLISGITALTGQLFDFFKPAQDQVVVYDLPQNTQGKNTVIIVLAVVVVVGILIYSARKK